MSLPMTGAFSVYREGKQEALRHKWIESERACQDLGEAALYQWVRMHWWGYLKARWLEHIHGTRYWIELDRGDFGILNKEFCDCPVLLDRIVDRLKCGQENLDIIQWAMDWALPIDRVLQILEALDVNGCRLSHRFDD